MAKSLFTLNPALNPESLAADFAANGRVQIREILTEETARELRDILMHHTPWGAAMQAGTYSKPQSWRALEMRDPQIQGAMRAQLLATNEAAAKRDYAFRSMRYSVVEAVQGGWDPGGPHEILLEHLNAEPFLGLMRNVSGMADLAKADCHASCYGPQHFLGLHSDSHVAEGWRLAYVLNLTIDDWYPDWGGYLQFFDEEGDIAAAWKPRFNSLNLFAVPVAHAVSYVPPFAPTGRYAVGGWLRDR